MDPDLEIILASGFLVPDREAWKFEHLDRDKVLVFTRANPSGEFTHAFVTSPRLISLHIPQKYIEFLAPCVCRIQRGNGLAVNVFEDIYGGRAIADYRKGELRFGFFPCGVDCDHAECQDTARSAAQLVLEAFPETLKSELTRSRFGDFVFVP